MQSDLVQEKLTWSDPRHLLMLTLPLGGFAWAGGTVFLAIFPFIYSQRDLPSEANKIAFAICSFVGVLVGIYYTLGAYQIFFLELRERFIARKVIYENGTFLLKGYYFKQDSFKAHEVASIEPVVVSERWFQKRLGTLLSRSTRFTIPHGKNVNLRIALRDGRVFYFPGEMGRPGQWKDEDVKELRDFMEGLAAANRHGR